MSTPTRFRKALAAKEKNANEKKKSAYTPLDYINRQKEREDRKRKVSDGNVWKKQEVLEDFENVNEKNNYKVDEGINLFENIDNAGSMKRNFHPKTSNGKMNLMACARSVLWDEANNCPYGIDKIKGNMMKLKVSHLWNEMEFLQLADKHKDSIEKRDFYLLEAFKCELQARTSNKNRCSTEEKNSEDTGNDCQLVSFRFVFLSKFNDYHIETPAGCQISLRDALKDKESTFTSTNYDNVVRKNLDHILDSIISTDTNAAVYTAPPNKPDSSQLIPLSPDFVIKCAEVLMDGCILSFETESEKHAQMNRTIDLIRSKTSNYLNKFRSWYKSTKGEDQYNAIKTHVISIVTKNTYQQSDYMNSEEKIPRGARKPKYPCS